MTRGIAATTASLLHAVQVERHGQYSAERLQQLHDFTTSTNSSSSSRTFRLILQLFATPLPCLLAVLLLDAIPLDPPTAGSSANVSFWVRASISNAACSLCLITLYESAIPTLRLSWVHVLATTVLVAIGTQLAGYGLSLAIGFPLPFTMMLMSPVYMTQLLGFLFFASVTHFRSCPSSRAALRDWMKVTAFMSSIIVVYPICNYAFETATPFGQSVISLLMGGIKVAYRNAISRCVREHGDLRPETVSFQAEVPSALFVVFSMRNASSQVTIALLLVVDVAHAFLALYDVRCLARRIAELERHSLGTSRFHSQQVARTNCVTPVPAMTPSSQHKTMIDRACAIISSREASFKPSPRPRILQLTGVGKHSLWCQRMCVRRIDQAPLQIHLPPKTTAAHVTNKPSKSPTVVLTAEKEYADAVLRLVFTTESHVLDELVEIIVPVVYGLYIAAMMHMPNRAYFPYLAAIDPASLRTVLIRMLAYGMLEFASLFVLCAMLQRQLGFSPIAQLSMVLRTRWRSVQAALIFWVIVNVQAPLEHYGEDYSFTFVWLRK